MATLLVVVGLVVLAVAGVDVVSTVLASAAFCRRLCPPAHLPSRRDCPESRVLLVTMHGDESTVLAALRAGGSGFVLKGAGLREQRNGKWR